MSQPGNYVAAGPDPQWEAFADAPRSQFEANTYGVVEKDVDVHAVWRTAQQCGFADIRLSVFHGTPFQVSLDEFEDLLAGGATKDRWVGSTRQFLRYVRSFTLIKSGTERLDSQSTEGLRCEIRPSSSDLRMPARLSATIEAMVTNAGTATWLPPSAGRGGVRLGTHLYDGSGNLLVFDHVCVDISQPPRDIAPGETFRCFVQLPPMSPGRYQVELDCVASNVTWFAQAGSRPARVTLEVFE